MVLIIIVVLILFAFLIGGIMAPIWMFINTMNLIVHLPLFKSNMPPNVHYFLLHYLDLFRLHF